VAYVRIAFEDRIDMIRELGSFVLVNRMADVGIRTLNSDLACLGCQATGRGLHFGMELRIVREYSVRYHTIQQTSPQPNLRVRPCRLHQR